MNNSIFFFFYSLAHQSKFLDTLVYFTAEVLPYITIFLAIVFLFFHKDKILSNNPFKELSQKIKEGVLVFLSAVLAWCASQILKFTFRIERPFTTFNEVTSLFSESGYAFPSGHATFFTALAFAIFLIHRKIGLWFIIIAIFIGIARIIAGVHYPVDILGGFVLGVLVAYFARFIYNQLNS